MKHASKNGKKTILIMGGDWLVIAARMEQLEIVQFLLTRDNAEQMMSNMTFWVYFNPNIRIEPKAFACTIEVITQACLKIKSVKLFDLFIEKVQKYIVKQPPNEQLVLQALVQQVQARFAATIKLLMLQHQKTDMTDTITKQQKHQYEQAKKCMQLEQKIVQQAPVAGLINAISEILETKIATYNPAKK